jgi:hypothetical protein
MMASHGNKNKIHVTVQTDTKRGMMDAHRRRLDERKHDLPDADCVL